MRIVKRHILPSLPGFKVKRSTLLVAEPIEMILRAFYFQTSSYVKEDFTVWAFAQPLYVPCDHLVLNTGGRLGWLWRGRDIWWTVQLGDAESEYRTMQDLLGWIQRVGLPFLESIQSPSDIVYWIQKRSGNLNDVYYQEIIAYSYVLLGEYETALRTINRLIPRLQRDSEGCAWMLEILERVETMKGLLQQSPEAALHQLRAWRRWTLRQLRLEKAIELD